MTQVRRSPEAGDRGRPCTSSSPAIQGHPWGLCAGAAAEPQDKTGLGGEVTGEKGALTPSTAPYAKPWRQITFLPRRQ